MRLTHDVAADAVRDVLDQLNIDCPPIDPAAIAKQLGLSVNRDRSLDHRGSINGFTKVIRIRPEDRPERSNWTIAHEIGEHVAHRYAADLELSGEFDAREQFANRFAGLLLAPDPWFSEDCRRERGDLLALKANYATASHEVLAYRFLDSSEPTVITVIDSGQIRRRQTNRDLKLPMQWIEWDAQREASETGQPASRFQDTIEVTAWPIHEPGNPIRREILRTCWTEW